MASKYIKKFKVPNNFENILSDFAKEILRNQPKDIIQFGIEYFKGLETNTPFDFKDKGENRPENYKRPENQEPNIINAPNKLEISQEDKNRLQRSMDKIERINKDPEPITEKEEEKGKKDEGITAQNEVTQGRHVSKYIQEEEVESHQVRKVITTEEVYVKKEETVIRNGEVIKKEVTEQRYTSGDGQNKQKMIGEEKPENEEETQGNARYGGIVEENQQHKKDYDDWFTKHSMDKQAIDYKPEEPQIDENLKRNEVGYNTWFNNHSVRSIDQSQGGDNSQGAELTPGDEEQKVELNKEVQNAEEGQGHKGDYGDWFTRHSQDKMVIDYKPPEKKLGENVIRNEIDYATWFENHSKLTNKHN